jgi:hypothetical protein
MDSSDVTQRAAELQRRAEENFGSERAETMRPDIEQLAKELHALNTYTLAFEDEP